MNFFILKGGELKAETWPGVFLTPHTHATSTKRHLYPRPPSTATVRRMLLRVPRRQRQIFMTPPLSLQRQTVVDVKLCTSGDVFHKSLIRTKQQLLLACSEFWEWSQDETVKFCEAGWRVYRHANGVAMSGNEVKTLRAGPSAANVSCLVAMLAAD